MKLSRLYIAGVCLFMAFGVEVYSEIEISRQCKSDIMNVLNETIVVPVKKFRKNRHVSKLPADISFMFVDLKYSKDKLKICEFGPGNTAGVQKNSTPLQFSNKTMFLRSPYWPFLWYYLAALNLPVWFVGKNPEQCTSKWLSAKTVHWHLYNKLGGFYAKDIQSLEHDPLFRKALKKKIKFDSSKISTYKGIVLFRTVKFNFQKRLEAFKKKHPDFIVIDEHTMKYSISKFKGSSVFKGFGLEKYKPKWGRFHGVYSKKLAKTIINKLNCQMFVIKPPNSNQARGVIVTTRKKLDKTLQLILAEKREHAHTYSYWKKDKHANRFIVEEYCSSKNINVNGELYDPTMRLFFILRCDNGKLYVTVTGGFWKIPNKSLNDSATLTEKHVTIPGDESRVGLAISRRDLRNARAMLAKALPGLYFNMLK